MFLVGGEEGQFTLVRAMMQYLGLYGNQHVCFYIYDSFAPVVLMLI